MRACRICKHRFICKVNHALGNIYAILFLPDNKKLMIELLLASECEHFEVDEESTSG